MGRESSLVESPCELGNDVQERVLLVQQRRTQAQLGLGLESDIKAESRQSKSHLSAPRLLCYLLHAQ